MRAVAVRAIRAVRAPGVLPLQLCGHAHEDAAAAGVRPAPVYAVSTHYLAHRPLNIPANCGLMSLMGVLCLNGQFDAIAQVMEQRLGRELAATGALEDLGGGGAPAPGGPPVAPPLARRGA